MPPDTPQPSRPRILVVEDEPSIADNIVYSLESEGFIPVVCRTGTEALEQAKRELWSLVILDVGLPDISGFEVCRRLLAQRDVPVIFLTARGQEVDRVVGLELGADDYVVKPFSPRELTARVRAVLRRAAKCESPTAAAIKPIEVDEERCVIRYFGQALQLPRYEFRLLRTLTKHPGRVFSRAQLMDHASDEPEAALERTVDAHIKSLRAALKAVKPEIDPILTHRGMGYALTEDWSSPAP
jgi:two-component system, OmpR family, catabolic regulation response regulator CreB